MPDTPGIIAAMPLQKRKAAKFSPRDIVTLRLPSGTTKCRIEGFGWSAADNVYYYDVVCDNGEARRNVAEQFLMSMDDIYAVGTKVRVKTDPKSVKIIASGGGFYAVEGYRSLFRAENLTLVDGSATAEQVAEAMESVDVLKDALVNMRTNYQNTVAQTVIREVQDLVEATRKELVQIFDI